MIRSTLITSLWSIWLDAASQHSMSPRRRPPGRAVKLLPPRQRILKVFAIRGIFGHLYRYGDTVMQRVEDPADPRRCQGRAPNGQCSNVAVEGGQHCLAHGGFNAMIRQQDADRRLYELTEARSQGRLTELVKHDPTTFLYDVTSLAVLLLEKMERATQQDSDFVTSYADFNALLLVIERLKRATLHIQQSVTVLIKKSSLYDLGRVLTDLTQEEVSEAADAAQIVARVSHELHEMVRSSANEENLPSLESSIPLTRTKTFNIKSEKDAQRLAELRHNDSLMSLYEEIAIQIIRLERRWNLVENDIELLAACNQLTQGLKNLERLIKSAHEQAQAIGELLNPVASRQIVLEMINVVSIELKRLPDYEPSIDRLRDRVMGHFNQSALPPLDEESRESSTPLLG